MKKNTIEDVLAKVEADPNGGCWLWSGVLNPGGYGMVKWNCYPTLVHRLVYTHLVGEIPASMHLCHRCDVRACCNPLHLFVGTHLENMLDRNTKGRTYTGQRAWTAKISREQAVCIHAMRRAGFSFARISKAVGCSSSNAHIIARRVTWPDITEAEISAFGAQHGVVFHNEKETA